MPAALVCFHHIDFTQKEERKLQHNYSYQSALAASERIGWKVDDIIGGDKQLDFSKPFMPESLAQVKQLSFLTPEEQQTLNQIRGHEYLAMFGLVEEFILPYVVDHARLQLSGDDYRGGHCSSSPAKKRSISTFSSASVKNSRTASAASATSLVLPKT
jgi:hypothetical protein